MFNRRDKYNRFNRSSGMDWFFDKVFFKLFIAVFAIAFIGVIVQFAVIGYVGYQVITDPMGSANFVGTVAGEVLKPVAEAVKGQ